MGGGFHIEDIKLSFFGWVEGRKNGKGFFFLFCGYVVMYEISADFFLLL